MPCYHPIPARQQGPGLPVELRPRVAPANLSIPCGTCIGCKSARATQWAHRCKHEASLYARNIFITLTFDEQHVPDDNYLNTRTLQLFIKRLRKLASGTGNSLITDKRHTLRYFACGEYGEQNARPHYHAIVFNCDFADRQKIGNKSKHQRYTSDALSALWPDGAADFGTFTPAAANYIAQYTLKKQTGPEAPYRYHDKEGSIDRDGVWHPRLWPAYNRTEIRPFLRMSLKPAIGTGWLTKYATDLQHGYLIEDGTKSGIPRIYKTKIKEAAEEAMVHAKYTDLNRNLQASIDRQTLQTKTLENALTRPAAERIHKRLKHLTENRTL